MRGVRVHLIPSSFLSRQVGSLYFSCDLVTIKNVSIGDNKIPNHNGAILNLWPYRFLIGRTVDFIIGVTTLEYGNWIFDFPNSKWEYVAY